MSGTPLDFTYYPSDNSDSEPEYWESDEEDQETIQAAWQTVDTGRVVYYYNPLTTQRSYVCPNGRDILDDAN